MVWDEDVVDWSTFDACLIRSTSDYHEKYDDFIAWIALVGETVPIWNPVEMAIWNADKTYLRALGDSGVPIIPTHWLERECAVSLSDVLDSRRWDDAIIKPTVGLGAKNLHRVRRSQQGDQNKLDELLSSYGVMVQPFLRSVESGETSLVYISGELTHVIKKIPKGGDFRVQGTWGGSVVLCKPTAAQLKVAGRALAYLDETPVYARVDLVDGPSGHPCLIELELLEPDLFFRQYPAAAERLAEAIRALLRSQSA